MTAEQLDEAYTALCRNLDIVGEAGAPSYLARLALLLMVDHDLDLVNRALEAALAADETHG